METQFAVLFISLAVFTQYKYHLMPKPSQKQVPTVRAIFNTFEASVKRDVEHGLTHCSHAHFKIRRIKSQPAHRRLVELALDAHSSPEFSFVIDETDTEFEITLLENPTGGGGDDDTIVPATPSPAIEEAVPAKGWFYN